jgi:peptidoglycan L-alanyl-D-glutamate endopeptidase CwlK
MSYVLSQRSRRELEGVDPHLKVVVFRAITLTAVDFLVFEGLRTPERQVEYVAKGVSRTLTSRHLTGEAVDLVPIVGGQPRWEMGACFKIADAMRSAAIAEGVDVRWGGCWDMLLNESVTRDCEEMAFGYVRRKLELDGRPFLDGPHFELTMLT